MHHHCARQVQRLNSVQVQQRGDGSDLRSEVARELRRPERPASSPYVSRKANGVPVLGDARPLAAAWVAILLDVGRLVEAAERHPSINIDAKSDDVKASFLYVFIKVDDERWPTSRGATAATYCSGYPVLDLEEIDIDSRIEESSYLPEKTHVDDSETKLEEVLKSEAKFDDQWGTNVKFETRPEMEEITHLNFVYGGLNGNHRRFADSAGPGTRGLRSRRACDPFAPAA